MAWSDHEPRKARPPLPSEFPPDYWWFYLIAFVLFYVGMLTLLVLYILGWIFWLPTWGRSMIPARYLRRLM